MQIGDTVQILDGSFAGKKGKVTWLSEDEIEELEVEVKTETGKKRILVLKNEVKPDYSKLIGDSVK